MSAQDHREPGHGEAAGLPGAFDVAPVSLLVPQGPYTKTSRIAGPQGSSLACGDRWPLPSGPEGMVASVEVYDGGLHVSLGLRIGFDDLAWTAFAGLPSVASLLATPPIVWFVVESAGLHSRAPFAIDFDPALAPEIRRCAADVGGRHSMTLFGLDGDTVRTIKVGIACDRIWNILADASPRCRADPPRPSTSRSSIAQAAFLPA